MLRVYIYTLLLPAIPAVGALLCILITGLVRVDANHRLLKRILICFFLSEVGLWVTSVFYNQLPEVFVYLSALTYLAMLLTQVIFFHFVFRITQQRSNESFSSFHYILPFVIAGVQGVWTLLVPFDVAYGLVESHGVPSAEYPAYSFYFLFKIKMRMLYSLVYSVWALVCIYRYRQTVVDYSSDGERTSLVWLKTLVFITFVLVLLPLSMVFRERSYFFTSAFLMPVMTVLILVQFALLVYNFLIGNYVQMSSESLHPDDDTDDKAPLLVTKPCRSVSPPLLQTACFEEFMRTNKPYLNAQLRIVDLAAMLGTNRSYLSAFINSTYGVNFSQLINSYRLDEFQRLEEEKPEINKMERAVMAGFGSYRNFARMHY